MSSREQLPPPSEQVHLPGPTFLPVVTAFGITVVLVGVVINWVVLAIGLLITVVAIARWIRDVREDIAELPLEH